MSIFPHPLDLLGELNTCEISDSEYLEFLFYLVSSGFHIETSHYVFVGIMKSQTGIQIIVWFHLHCLRAKGNFLLDFLCNCFNVQY